MTSRGERANANGTAVVSAFPWELAVGAFAGASVLLAIVLERAGSTVPALIFGLLGVVLTCVAAVTGWRRVNANPRRRVRGRMVQAGGKGANSSLDQLDFGEASPGDTVRSRMATRTGEDGAEIDLGKIPDFRARRDRIAVVPRDASAGGQAGSGSNADPGRGDDAGWGSGGGRVLGRSLSRWHVTSRQSLERWRLRCLSDVVDYLCHLLHLGTGRRPERFAPVRHRGRSHPEVRRAMPHHRSFP